MIFGNFVKEKRQNLSFAVFIVTCRKTKRKSCKVKMSGKGQSAANMVKAFSLPGFTEVSNEECSDSEDDCVDNSLEDVEEIEDRDKIYYDLYEICQHVPCFAHTLQLVIKDGFKQAGNINKVISKVSSIVSHVKKSIHAAEVP